MMWLIQFLIGSAQWETVAFKGNGYTFWRTGVQESKQEVTEVVSLVKSDRKNLTSVFIHHKLNTLPCTVIGTVLNALLTQKCNDDLMDL